MPGSSFRCDSPVSPDQVSDDCNICVFYNDVPNLPAFAPGGWIGMLSMKRSRRLAVVAISVCAGLACAGGIAQARERGPRTEIACPMPPMPATIDGDTALAYELHITNFDRVPLTLTNVFIASDSGTPLLSLSG